MCAKLTNSYIVVDIETTGVRPTMDRITEIGAVKVIDGEVVASFDELINPKIHIPEQITHITGIDDEMVKGRPDIEFILPKFLEFASTLPIVGHNIIFDFSFLKYHASCQKLDFERKGIDTLKLSGYFVPDLPSRSLASLIQHFDISREKAHRAYDDALATYHLLEIFREQWKEDKYSFLFEPKPLHWRIPKQSPITPRQIKYLEDLIKKYRLYENLDIKTLSKSEASRYIDRIRSEKGLG